MKGKISTKGYKKDSPDRDEPYLTIPSGNITMFGVPYPVYGVDNLGNAQMMYPNQNYQFPGSYVTETPAPDGYHYMPDGSLMSDDEMRRGGPTKRRKTSKNIKSSINELFLRNYDVYGLPGRRVYDPKAKEGGEMKYFPFPPHLIGNPTAWYQLGGNFEVSDIDFYDEDFEEFKTGGIHIAKNKRGTFTAAATKHKMGVQEFANHVLANKDKFSPKMVKKANFAHNAAGWSKQMGGGFDVWKAEQIKKGYKLVPGAQNEFYDPNKYKPTSDTDRTAPWQSLNNAPLMGTYPAEVFGYAAPAKPVASPKSSNYIDTSSNPYIQVGFGQNPMYQNKKTGEVVPAAIVMKERQAMLNPGTFKGGGEYLKSLVKVAFGDLKKKKMGGANINGMSMDEVLAQRNNTFKNHLATNALHHLAMEESDNLDGLHNAMKMRYQNGGEGPDNSDVYWNTHQGYNGGVQNIVDLDTPQAPQFYFPANNFDQGPAPGTLTVTPELTPDAGQVAPQQSAWDYMSNDVQKASFQGMGSGAGTQSQEQSQNWFQRNKGPLMAEGIIAGTNLLTAAINARQNRNQNELLKRKMNADNMFQPNQKNRGAYDTNSGMMRPDQYGFAQYQKGGEHYLSASEIKKLKALGYQIEELD